VPDRATFETLSRSDDVPGQLGAGEMKISSSGSTRPESSSSSTRVSGWIDPRQALACDAYGVSVHSLPRRRALPLAVVVLALAGVLGAVAVAGGFSGSPARAPGALPADPPPAPVIGCRYRPRSTNVRTGPASGRRIALTFDDGPSAYTSRVLDVLESQNVPATFFIVGRNVAGREELLSRMLTDGDMIGNHSFTHADLSKASAASLKQIDDTQAAIRGATGFNPCLLRPPYGRTSKKLLGALRSRRLTSTLWSVNPQDFLRPGTATIKRRVLAGVKPGSIILDHDGGGDRSQTLAAIPEIIQTLKARGYTFVTVTDLLGLGLKR
jgi:peptidoglycan/xylan/chitin deacetylase (PgdA/CDA1 family)